MKLSIYTFVKNGIYYDFHIVDMLRHHLPFVDEIIVNEGYSTDGTYEAIKDIDPKIKIFRSNWNNNDPTSWHREFKNETRKHCSGDWCILLDCDEFIPEWEFPAIKDRIAKTKNDILSMNYLNFYGNYKVYNCRPLNQKWPGKKFIIHKNRKDMEVWGDGSNVRIVGKPNDYLAEETGFMCHHFGFVRNAAKLRKKWREQSAVYKMKKFKWLNIPLLIYRFFPYDWFDKDIINDLTIYNGPYINTVVKNPDEFVRDKFKLYTYLKKNKK